MKRNGEIEKQIAKRIDKAPIRVITVVLCVLAVCFFAMAVYVRIGSSKIANQLGDDLGTLTGKVIGSSAALLDGKKAADEAIADALSAKDTEAELATKIREEQKLEVLVMGGSFVDEFEIGENYKVLLSMDYDAVFTVDLSTAEIKLSDDGLHILVDEPKLGFYPKDKVDKIAEWNKEIFDGSAEKGIAAFIGYMNTLKEKAEEELNEDDSLMTAAKLSAEEQLEALAKAVSVSKIKPAVFTEFRGSQEAGA